MEASKGSLLLHLFAFIVCSYGLIWDILYLNLSNATGRTTYGGRWKFLTFWNMIIQTVYFGYSLINDLFGSNTKPWEASTRKRSKLQRIRDDFLASIMFPIGCFVVMTFWGIYAVDRELVYPKRLDAIIPSWLNHVMHTTILPFLLVEKYLVYHQYPRRKKGFAFMLGFAGLYQIWILWIAYYANIWVYPVLAVLSWPGRAAFLGGLWAFLIVIYLVGEYITHLLWTKNSKAHAHKIK